MIKPKRVRCVGHVALTGDMRNAYRILVGKAETKIPIVRHSSRWEDNIRMDLKEIGWEGVDWIGMAQDRGQWWVVVSTVMNLRVP
jgi:hypothetical protein